MSMGHREISVQLPTDYTEAELKEVIAKKLRIKEFSYEPLKKSLDARDKGDIYWNVRLSVFSQEIKGGTPELPESLNIPYQKRKEKVVVVGSGPAGFFSALVLQKAGYQTTLIERGSKVTKRTSAVSEFEKTGAFNPMNNYAFGEGGAGTFSDGKLTSRSKRISKENNFILSSYIKAGAPKEIGYMAHPHLGSDNLKKIVEKLREEFQELGGKILFETLLEDLRIENGKVCEAITSSGSFEADYFLIASGHSAYDTYRMLIRRGVKFRTKSFAIGSRVEHAQELINRAQWGRESLPGVKAAEYRLTSNIGGKLPVYTFCMCPGGIVVPATAYKNTNIVNGMSCYARGGKFANAACVAGVHIDQLTGRQTTPLEALDWVQNLEESFFKYSDGFQAPFCTIQDFIDKKEPSKITPSSYPLGLKPAALWNLLPGEVSDSIREALKNFSRKIKGYDRGSIMGLESKTSSPIQAIREKNKLSTDLQNLYIIGEGSGYAGGIISSGADGIKAAMAIVEGN